MRGILIVLFIFIGVGSTTHADDNTDLKTIVARLIASDLKVLDDVVARHEKNKLKPAERIKLFGKKEPPKPKRVERLNLLRKQIELGTFSFREPFGAVNVRQVISRSEFLGSYLSMSSPVVALFRNMPNSDVVDGEDIRVDIPTVVTDRYQYDTAVGRKTTQVIEPLSICVKRLKESEIIR